MRRQVAGSGRGDLSRKQISSCDICENLVAGTETSARDYSCRLEMMHRVTFFRQQVLRLVPATFPPRMTEHLTQIRLMSQRRKVGEERAN
jgi:hypothetical protein